MGKAFKRIAAALVLLSALANGLLGPMAHGHALPVPATEIAAPIATAEDAVHEDCAGHEDSQVPSHPGGHSHGKAPGKAALVCSGATACCAALAVIDLPFVVRHERVELVSAPRQFFVGLTPQVGERPPSHV